MLRKTPGAPRFIIVLIMLITAFWGYRLVRMYSNADVSGFWEQIFFSLPLFALFSVIIVKMLRMIINVRNKGRRSLEYLEKYDLLEMAADEYFGIDKTECRITHTAGESDKFGTRNNALTQNFIFAMSDNIIVPYRDLKSAGIVRCAYNSNKHDLRRGFSFKQDIIFAETLDGRRIDIHAVEHKNYTEKQKQIVEKIFSRIERANPECKVDRTIIGEHTAGLGL